jgi:RHS repeat-associated protein
LFHLATYGNGASGTTYFIQQDWLGTERSRVLPDGDMFETCTSLPFGDDQICSGSGDPSPNHFTGKQRDTESNLDYFGARHYISAMGRFMQPDWEDRPTDVPYAALRDPQSLNLYGYVRNDPVSQADEEGHCPSSSDNCPGDANVPGNVDAREANASAAQSQQSGLEKQNQKPNPPLDSGCKTANCVTVTATADSIPYTYVKWLPSLKIPTIEEVLGVLGTVARGAAVPFIAASYLISPPYKYAKDTTDPEPKKEHTKGARKSTWGKHSKPRPGRSTTKDRLKPGFKPRTPPRPQDM